MPSEASSRTAKRIMDNLDDRRCFEIYAMSEDVQREIHNSIAEIIDADKQEIAESALDLLLLAAKNVDTPDDRESYELLRTEIKSHFETEDKHGGE